MWASNIIFCVQHYDIKIKWSNQTFISYSLSAQITESSTTCQMKQPKKTDTDKVIQLTTYTCHSFTVVTLCNL